MFNNVIVRIPPKSISEGLGSGEDGKPIYEKTLVEHANYISAMTKTGVDVTVLEPKDEFPDSVFVEDVAICTSKCAIITRPGAPTRQEEVQLSDMRETLEEFYDNIEQIEAPGTLEGGDVVLVDDYYYIGLSDRTNEEGARQLIEILEKYGLSGETVEVTETLHLGTGMSYLKNNNMLVTGELIDAPQFKDFNKIEIGPEDAYAANTVWMNGYVIVPKGYPEIQKQIEDLGYDTIALDTTEISKIDGSLTCLSLRF